MNSKFADLVKWYYVIGVVMRRDMFDVADKESLQEEFWTKVVNFCPDIVVAKDTDGRYIDCNAAFEKFAGKDKADIVGKSDDQIFDTNSAELFYIKKDGKTLELTEKREIILSDGRRLILEVSQFPLFSADNHSFICLIARDITESEPVIKGHDVLEDRFEQTVFHSKILVWEIDKKGLLTYMSKSAIKLLGYDAEELIGKKYFYDLCPPELQEQFKQEVFELLGKGEAYTDYIHSLYNKNGEEVRVSGDGIPIFDDDGVLQGYRGTVKDITNILEKDAALDKSQDQFYSIFSNSINGIHTVEVLFDENNKAFDLIFLQVNEAAEEHTGKKAEDVIGRKMSEAFPGGEDDEIVQIYAKVVTTGEPVSLEYYFLPLNSYFQVHVYKIDENVCTSMFFNITKSKRQNIVNEIKGDIFGELNSDKTLKVLLEDVVRIIKEKSGVDAVALRFKDEDDYPYISHCGFDDNFIKAENSLLSKDKGGTVKFDQSGKVELECMCGLVISEKTDSSQSFFTEHGSFFTNNSSGLLGIDKSCDERINPRNRCINEGYNSIALIPVKADNKVVAMLQLNDRRPNNFDFGLVKAFENLCDTIGIVISRRKLEEDLIVSNRYLEKATEKSNKMAIEADMANSAKSQFLANMSHELRTPMNAILGFCELLFCENLNEEQREFADIIYKQGNLLLQLMNDILDFSSIDSGKLKIEYSDCNIDDFISQLESVFRNQAKSKGLYLKVNKDSNVPAVFKSDYVRVSQCLMNLVNNAIKFTKDGGVIVDICVRNDEVGKRLHFSIKDTGIGIEHTKHEDIFDYFTQANNTNSREYGGAGLGLAISKRLANLLGGDIDFVSEPGKGSVFDFKIPLEESAHRLIRRDGSGNEELIEGKFIDKDILVVEDSLVNQKLLCIILEKMGFNVKVAGNGQEAIDIVLKQDFDMIFMDIQMPVMNGYDATKDLRGKGIDVPIIALTANAMKSDRQKCIDAGCSDYMSKPVDSQQLADILSAYFNQT
ncbi:MAG: PAS domain S-box protein [Sedimentisphaeraceae bacterium JB056]